MQGSEKALDHIDQMQTAKDRPLSAPARRQSQQSKKVQQPKSDNKEKEYTFKPKINNYVTSKSRELTSQQRIEQLSRSRRDVYIQRERLKAEREREALKECTFRPRIRSKTSTNVNNTTMEASMNCTLSDSQNMSRSILQDPFNLNYSANQAIPVEERLYHEADARAEKRERAKRDLEEQQLAEFSFTPRINSTSIQLLDMTNYTPLYNRVGELQRKKNEQIHKRRIAELQNNPDLTFAPRVNQTSDKLIRTMIENSGIDIHDRLHTEFANAAMRKQRVMEDVEEKQRRDCTFKPQVNSTSEKIVQQLDVFSADFVERQEVLRQRQQQRNEMIQRQKEAEEPSFTPRIGKNSALLVNAKPCRAAETEEERLARLAHRDKQRTEALKECIKDQYYAQFSFKPEINKISKAIAKPKAIDELASDERRKQAHQMIAEQVEQEFKQKYTFRPQLISKQPAPNQNTTNTINSTSMSYMYNVNSTMNNDGSPENKYRLLGGAPDDIPKKIEELNRRKEIAIDQQRKRMEYEELNGCTFQPMLISKVAPPKQPSGPVVIRGLGNFLSRKDLAKRLEEEKRDREEKAFQVRISNKQRTMPYTKPEPFNLHSDYMSEIRKHEKKEKWLMKEMEECTFRPKTNATTTRDIVDKLLLHTANDSENSGSGNQEADYQNNHVPQHQHVSENYGQSQFVQEQLEISDLERQW